MTTSTKADKFIGLTEAGQRIGVSPWTIRERVRAGLLPAYRTGPGSEWRVKATDVAAFIAARTVVPELPAAQTDQR